MQSSCFDRLSWRNSTSFFLHLCHVLFYFCLSTPSLNAFPLFHSCTPCWSANTYSGWRGVLWRAMLSPYARWGFTGFFAVHIGITLCLDLQGLPFGDSFPECLQGLMRVRFGSQCGDRRVIQRAAPLLLVDERRLLLVGGT